MNIDKMREEFEVWYLRKFCGGQARLFRCVNADQIYYFTEVQSKWDAWQASRESLVIELEPVRDHEIATAAIEAAGLKVAK